jgi:hypothetical protein
MKTRTLKIECAGDGWRGQIIPKIRLAGQWLERAGFKPGNRVEVQLSEQGTLTLRFVNHASLPMIEPAIEARNSQKVKNRTETGQLNFS